MIMHHFVNVVHRDQYDQYEQCGIMADSSTKKTIKQRTDPVSQVLSPKFNVYPKQQPWSKNQAVTGAVKLKIEL